GSFMRQVSSLRPPPSRITIVVSLRRVAPYTPARAHTRGGATEAIMTDSSTTTAGAAGSSGRAADGSTYLDLHVHSSDGSDDAGGSVEGYLKWVQAKRKQGFRIDGFAVTEHRRFDLEVDYRELAERYDAIVLRGVEVETDIGHVLVFGVTPAFLEQFDLKRVDLPYADVF